MEKIIHNGFYDERDELIKEMYKSEDDFDEDEVLFDFLVNETADPENGYKEGDLTAYDFLHGYCNVFAWILSQKTGLAPIGMYEYGRLIHAFVETDNGYIDIRGFTDDYDEFIQEFYENGLCENSDCTKFKEILKRPRAKKDIYQIAEQFYDKNTSYYRI